MEAAQPQQQQPEGRRGREGEFDLTSYPLFEGAIREGEDEMMAASRLLEEGGEVRADVERFLLSLEG